MYFGRRCLTYLYLSPPPPPAPENFLEDFHRSVDVLILSQEIYT